MSRQNRKRKCETADFENDVIVPKHKLKTKEEAQAEEEQLTKILFGGASNFLKSLEEAEQEAGPSNINIDSGVGETDDSDDCDQKERNPAWFDEEDDGIEVGAALDAQGRQLPNAGSFTRTNHYQNLLKEKFISFAGTPTWADVTQKDDGEDSDSDELLQSCGFVKQSGKQYLPESTIEYKKVKDLNCETYTEGPYVNAIKFHPTSSVALVAGNAGVVSLLTVDGRKNSKLHSISFTNYPILSAEFVNCGNEIILGSRHKHIFTYDLLGTKSTKIPLPHGLMQCRNFVISPDQKYIAVSKREEVHFLSTATWERIGILKQNSTVTSLCYSPDGSLLYGHSDTGEVTVWDMNARRFRHRWVDDGCLQGTKIVVSPSNQFIATGSAQGVVNLYDSHEALQYKTPTPRKTVLNLTTGITDLNFNPTSEALAFSSSDVQTSIRLLHLGSLTVFHNFPCFGTKLGNITVTNFSPGGGYFALGNKKSTVALYRMKHYKTY